MHRRSLLSGWLSSFILLLFLAPAWGQGKFTAEDLADTFRVGFTDLGGKSVIWAENLQDLPFTVTIDMTQLTNVASAEGSPVTVTVPGRTRINVVHLEPVDPHARYRYNFNWHCTFGSREAHHDPATVYRLPFASGTQHKISQGFHGKFSHTGDSEYAVDFLMPEGTAVLAARDGKVVRCVEKFSEGGTDDSFWTRYNCVQVQHDDGTIGEYDHLRYNGAAVNPGDMVHAGDLVGYSGNTGYSQGPHLHFYVYRAVDGFKRESFPIRFAVAGSEEAVEPVQGQVYRAP